MVSYEPPLARSGNSTHLLDIRIPMRQAPETSHSVGITAGLQVSNPKALVTPEELAVVCECALDDINNRCSVRNEQRAEKRQYEEIVSDDETIMGMDDYLAMTVAPRRTASPGQDIPPQVVTPVLQLVDLMTAVPLTPRKYAFTDEDAAKNVQAPMQNTVPDALLEMFGVGAYIPMSMFLVENMELIRLDQGVKTHVGLGVRVVEAANFCDEQLLNFTLYAQAYHNFLKCTEMCMPPGSLLPRAWDAHFLGASQDPRFMAEWKIFLYMDIKMCQQLVNSPFVPVPGSPLYRDGYDIVVAQLCHEEECATWSAIRL